MVRPSQACLKLADISAICSMLRENRTSTLLFAGSSAAAGRPTTRDVLSDPNTALTLMTPTNKGAPSC